MFEKSFLDSLLLSYTEVVKAFIKETITNESSGKHSFLLDMSDYNLLMLYAYT